MKHFKFELTIGYEGDAETEEDFINDVSDDIKRDWMGYIDEGDIEEVEQKEVSHGM